LFCDADRRDAHGVQILRELLAPPICLGCGAPGADLCAACRRGLPWLADPRCARCGLPGSCRRCPAAGLAFGAAWAPVAYAGPALALVAALKFRRVRVAAEPMVAAMARAPHWLGGEAPLLVPVPTARSRAKARGFDQAITLASGLAARGVGDLLACLERTGRAPRQVGADRRERLSAGRIEVRVRPGAAVSTVRAAEGPAGVSAAMRSSASAMGAGARTFVLVDDVHTTGATLDACARALKAAGAERVVALTYARALP